MKLFWQYIALRYKNVATIAVYTQNHWNYTAAENE